MNLVPLLISKNLKTEPNAVDVLVGYVSSKQVSTDDPEMAVMFKRASQDHGNWLRWHQSVWLGLSPFRAEVPSWKEGTVRQTSSLCLGHH